MAVIPKEVHFQRALFYLGEALGSVVKFVLLQAVLFVVAVTMLALTH
jgi:hypothetical protein